MTRHLTFNAWKYLLCFIFAGNAFLLGYTAELPACPNLVIIGIPLVTKTNKQTNKQIKKTFYEHEMIKQMEESYEVLFYVHFILL